MLLGVIAKKLVEIAACPAEASLLCEVITRQVKARGFRILCHISLAQYFDGLLAFPVAAVLSIEVDREKGSPAAAFDELRSQLQVCLLARYPVQADQCNLDLFMSTGFVS